MTPSFNAVRLASSALSALRQGDAASAHRALIEARDAGHVLSQDEAWLLAQSCRRLDDINGEIAALHLTLKSDSRHLGALFAMGDAFARKGDERAAMSWFRTALAQGALSPSTTHLAPHLDRAQAYCDAAASRLADHLTDEIQSAGIDKTGSPAFQHALAILSGDTQPYLQQPSMFYYPCLPQRAFYEREDFAWVKAFEAGSAQLLGEYQSLMEGDEPFAPYVTRSSTRPAPSNPLLNDMAWGSAYLWRDGAPTALAACAPQTMAALAQTPQPTISKRSPMALYSRLMPGAHIKPHHGMLNTRLICHLPLIVPEGCALRVGHETREWRFGEMLIFDDSIEHEAWNRGNSDRTILLFEIWRPEIPMEDREALGILFAAIDKVDPAIGQEGTV
ncbi:MAG: aspartyl/asparaginyl beta-hydroxylase domain-containing protein [Sphingopyxis sp.]